MPNTRPVDHAERLPLSQLPTKTRGRIAKLTAGAETCQRLREMGFCESAVIEKIADNHLLICQLCNTRVALSNRTAQHILVEVERGPTPGH